MIELIKDVLSKKIETTKRKVSVNLVKNDECAKNSCSLLGKEDFHKEQLNGATLDHFA